MRKLAIDFYTDFFSAGSCVVECVGLPRLGEAQASSLESHVSFEEMMAAVQQLSCGKASRVD